MESVSNRKEITVHPLSSDPTKAWKVLKHQQNVQKLKPLPLDTPIKPEAVRFVCMSDTHSRMWKMKISIPPGDVFLHAGDFTMYGVENEVRNFNSLLGNLPHRYKIVIAGNHETTFDPSFGSNTDKGTCTRSLLTNCRYLEDTLTSVYGIKIYGTPWQPRYCGWAFNLDRGQACLEKWNSIPEGVDVLLTHTPPVGHGDHCVSDVRAGCVELLTTVKERVKPKYHVFGHIHEGYGITTDGQTVFMNASTCNVRYNPVNPPIIFDLPIPEGFTKQ